MALETRNCDLEATEERKDEHVLFSQGQEATTIVQEMQPDTTVQVGKRGTSATSREKKEKRETRQRPCHFFARDKCRDGEACKFSHETKPKKNKQNVSVAIVPTTEPQKKKKKPQVRKCKYFARNKCRDGDKCKFSHDIKKGGASNSKTRKHKSDLPQRAVVVQLGGPAVSGKTLIEDNSEWSDAQQRALDLALKKYPVSMDKEGRWTSIASEVDGRSLNECIDRFTLLCDLVRRGVDLSTVISERENRAEERTESTRSEHHAHYSKIIPQDKRAVIVTEPEAKGTSIHLEDLFLHGVGTVVAHQLVCQLQCDNCPFAFDAILSLDADKIQKWCPRCSVLHHVAMIPVFAHSQSDVLAYVDTKNCSIVDVLPSDVLVTCLECGCEALLERVAPTQRAEQTCFSCHLKVAVMAKRFVAQQQEKSRTERSKSFEDPKSKKLAKKSMQTFVPGQPLPRNGACDHYRHSLRWFRFQCCGKAFPCDVCHDSSDCNHANIGKRASRVICGLCSKEQASSVKVCSCGNDVAATKSTTHHWEGGTGCRNYSLMSRWDKQKHRGQNKTESTKFSRVGAEAKKRRENANTNVLIGVQ